MGSGHLSLGRTVLLHGRLDWEGWVVQRNRPPGMSRTARDGRLLEARASVAAWLDLVKGLYHMGDGVAKNRGAVWIT